MRLLKNGTPSEDDIQKTMFAWVRAKKLDDIIIHIPNEGKRTKKNGNRLKLMGMCPGAWDINILRANHGYIGAWIEVKSKDGALTPHQKAFGEIVRGEGYYTAVVYNIDEGIKTLRWYMEGSRTKTI